MSIGMLRKHVCIAIMFTQLTSTFKRCIFCVDGGRSTNSIGKWGKRSVRLGSVIALD